MTPRQAAARETRRAASWRSCCAGMVETLERRLHDAIVQGESCGLDDLRFRLAAAKSTHQQAVEDWKGWQSFQQRYIR